MEIINAHAHIYPEKIAKKATDTIGVFYDIKMQMPAGTAERLIEDGSRAGITGYVVHSVATTAHQVRSINEFLLREVEAHPEFIGFIALHQDLSEDEIIGEVNWALRHGFRGIKLHPDFQGFEVLRTDVKDEFEQCPIRISIDRQANFEKNIFVKTPFS